MDVVDGGVAAFPKVKVAPGFAVLFVVAVDVDAPETNDEPNTADADESVLGDVVVTTVLAGFDLAPNVNVVGAATGAGMANIPVLEGLAVGAVDAVVDTGAAGDLNALNVLPPPNVKVGEVTFAPTALAVVLVVVVAVAVIVVVVVEIVDAAAPANVNVDPTDATGCVVEGVVTLPN